MSEIPYGYCHCGCGEKTTVPEKSNYSRGIYAGVPLRFVYGHQWRVYVGERHPSWQGGRRSGGNGYIEVHAPDHPNAGKRGYVGEHVLVASRVLGKPLPKGAQVHHINEDRTDNRPENLVICPSLAYHRLIHSRMTALRECGHAGWRKCVICHQWDAPENMRESKANRYVYHRACYNERYPKRKRTRA